MAQLFETVCMSLVFNKSHSLAMHYCRLVWDVRSLSNIPYSLFEALNLTSLNTSYLDAHIEKIFKYDTLGYRYNFIVSYVSVKDFNAFWTKYLGHIKKYEYPYQLGSVEENVGDKYCYPNLKVAAITLIRNGMNTTLYHICVLMQE